MKPISDTSLQKLRGGWLSFYQFQNKCEVSTDVVLLLQILARLDAAESRVAELQREVERLNGFLEMRQIIC